MVEQISAPELITPEQKPAVDRNATTMAEWERCKHWIQAALDHDGDHYTIEDVWRDVSEGRATFWSGKRSAVISQFWNFPRARVCHYWLAGGDMGELLDEMMPVIEGWAKAQGCSETSLGGRKGWQRALAPYGFELAFTVLRKRL